MAEASIPVDLTNPGQVFACIGLLEAAEVLLGEAQAGFEWTDTAPSFRMRTAGKAHPFAEVIAWVRGASVETLAPPGSGLNTSKWQVSTRVIADPEPFPTNVPDSPATLPARLLGTNGKAILIDHWGDSTNRDNAKFWAGAGGYPGAALLRDAIELLRTMMPAGVEEDPFAFHAPQTSSFRFDWRRDYVDIDAGFSPNKHESIVMQGYPLVEIFAALGLSNARPLRVTKLRYRYGVVGPAVSGELLDPVFLRAALGAVRLPLPMRLFTMNLDWPGQDGQARCITTVLEETYE